MTYKEAKALMSGLLLGDNANATTALDANASLFLAQAVNDVSRRCVPTPLEAVWDETVTDVFRRLPSVLVDDVFEHRYIKTTDFSTVTDATVLPVDEDLTMAVVYFLCSYFSKRNKKDKRFDIEADKVITLFNVNKVDPTDYEE